MASGNSTGLPTPIVQTQTPIFQCVPASYNISGGTPPYQEVFIIQSGEANADTLKTLPLEDAAGTFSWGVDIDAGTSITFVAKDSLNQTGYSPAVVIQAGNSGCFPKKHHSHTGEIVGGVVGGVAAIAAAYLLISWYHRRARAKLRDELVGKGEIEVVTVETGYGKTEERVVRRPTYRQQDSGGSNISKEEVPSGDDLSRQGTFNLEGVPVRPKDEPKLPKRKDKGKRRETRRSSAIPEIREPQSP